jgi:hypothetical protein
MSREDAMGVAADETPRGRRAGKAPRNARAMEQDDRLAGERERDERDIDEDRELTDEDRLEMFKDSLQQSVLPSLPNFPGWHCFWATTTNPRDSIQRRLMLGYKLIRIEEFPGWEGTGVKVGASDGIVGMNEMVAMRIPLRLYHKYMLEAHHRAPLAEEEKIRSAIEGAKAEAGRDLVVEEGDGTADLVQRTKSNPVFTE